jgi:DNA invertase Pin-like site-specific DNA recombinase
MNKIIGYARVSTLDQNLSAQIDFLTSMGCHKIFQEKISATAKDRSELKKALKALSHGDCLIVSNLDRLGRSVKELIRIFDMIKAKGAHLKTSNGIDTSSIYGTFMFHIFSALAEMEISILRERTKMGIVAARMRGRVGGRPRGISRSGEEIAEKAEILYSEKKMSVDEICLTLAICRGTLYKYLKVRGVSLRSKEKDDRKF